MMYPAIFRILLAYLIACIFTSVCFAQFKDCKNVFFKSLSTLQKEGPENWISVVVKEEDDSIHVEFAQENKIVEEKKSQGWSLRKKTKISYQDPKTGEMVRGVVENKYITSKKNKKKIFISDPNYLRGGGYFDIKEVMHILKELIEKVGCTELLPFYKQLESLK